MIQKNKGFTPTDLQLLLRDDLEKTLADVPLLNPKGEVAKIKAYPQYLPIPQDIDEGDEMDMVPYIIPKIQTGEKGGADPFVITFGLVICVYNHNDKRAGHFDLMNVIQRLESRFAQNNMVGNFEVQPSFDFALQESDTHPYYYGGVILKFNAPKSIKEVSFYT